MINWDSIYTKHAPTYLAICRRYIQDIDLAKDLMHDGFLLAIEKAHQYNGFGKIENWIKKIIVNHVLQHLRQSKNSHVYVDNYTESQQIIEEKIVGSQYTHEQMLEAIDVLPEHYKIVFNLYVLDGFSHKRISQILDISLGTSKSYLSRARIKIQLFLMNEYSDKKRKQSKVAALLSYWIFPDKSIDKMYKESFKSYTIASGYISLLLKIHNVIYRKVWIKSFAVGFTFAILVALLNFILDSPVHQREVNQNSYLYNDTLHMESADTINHFVIKSILNVEKTFHSSKEIKPEVHPVIKRTIIVRDTVYEEY